MKTESETTTIEQAGNPRLAPLTWCAPPAPYYQADGITIYHGDCSQIMPMLGEYSLLLTDPPYGIGEGKRSRVMSRANTAAATDYGENEWDSKPVDRWVMELARSICKKQIIWGGNYYQLPECKGPLVWDKENTGDFADGEMAWNNLGISMKIKRHRWNGMLRKGNEHRWHPTQKPLEVIAWALSLAGEVEAVIDPWMGSGTTLRACKDVGKPCVGIEREERYCEVAAERLAQGVLGL